KTYINGYTEQLASIFPVNKQDQSFCNQCCNEYRISFYPLHIKSYEENAQNGAIEQGSEQIYCLYQVFKEHSIRGKDDGENPPQSGKPFGGQHIMSGGFLLFDGPFVEIHR